MNRATTLRTSDGLDLEAEWSEAESPTATVVLCHPHPQYGGTMRSIVISALFEGLPAQGYACLRFNFRGVERSEGAWDEGRSELLDVRAALDAAKESQTGPLVLVGWSFGGDMALAVEDPALAGWIGIAPPLRFRAATDYAALAADTRPKLLILGANDEFRAPTDVERDVREWTNTRIEVIAGASHFFVGRTDRVVDLAADFVGGLALR
jgi:alpha/beta superfamily hydrolase